MSGKSSKRARRNSFPRTKTKDLLNAELVIDDVPGIQEYLTEWSSDFTVYQFYVWDIKDSVKRLHGSASVIADAEAEHTAAFQLETWRSALESVSPIYCEDDFASLAVTMCETAPRESIRAEDILGKDGLLVFRNPITIRPTSGAVKTWTNCRAIAWKTVPGGQHSSLVINVWVDSVVADNGSLRGGHVQLRLTGHETTFIRSGQLTREDHTLVRFLRAVTSLVRSRTSASSSVHSGQGSLSAFEKGEGQPRVIRRVYLRNPDDALYEAEALLAESPGRPPMRLHWVRGHWRKQWYPSDGLHRWKWIEGFKKGSDENGTVQGEKVLVAR